MIFDSRRAVPPAYKVQYNSAPGFSVERNRRARALVCVREGGAHVWASYGKHSTSRAREVNRILRKDNSGINEEPDAER